MANKMKALSLAVIAGLIMGPIAVNAAYAEDEVAVDPAPITEVVEEAVAEEPPTEPVAEPEAAPEAKPVEEKAPSVEPAPAPAPVAKVQTRTQPDFICDEDGAGWGPKIDTSGDPATVEVTADAGMLIDAYCVKAGTTKHIIQVDPPAATVIVDHPEKNSVSHYQIHQVKIPEEEPEDPTVSTCQTFGSVHTTDLSTWNLSETRATGHNELVEDGLHVWTEGATSTDKAAGYYPASFDLVDAGSGFGIAATDATGGYPGLQMLVDLDNDGDNEGFLVYEPVYGANTLWLSANWGGADLSGAPTSVNGGGTGKGGHVNDWLAEHPDAHVSAIGYSLGSGVKGDLVITSITVGCTVYTFDYVAPPTYEPSCTTVTGEQTIIGDGVLTVEGGWATDSIDVPFTGTLADIGTVLNIDASPLQYVGLHIDTAEGTIVFEEEESYAGNLWSESAWDGVEAGMGYAAFGSIEQFIHLNGDVEVTGIRLLYTHPEASSTTVTSFTIGCTVYTFEPKAEKPEPVVEYKTESVTDCYQSTITYQDFSRTTGEPTYNAEDNTWTQGEFGPWVESGEPRVTPATAEDCPLPDDEVTNGEWTYTVNCNTEVGSELPATREVTTVTYSYNEQGEVVSASSTSIEKGTHVVTEADIEALDCPVVNEPNKPAPAKAPSSRGLAATGGGDVSPLVPLAGGLAAALGIGLVAFAAIRRRSQA